MLSVVIITLNEENNIGRCIESVKAIADEIIVLDSYSIDRTVEIATEKGAIVKQELFIGYKEQKNLALKFVSHNYVLSLDADEALSPELSDSIKKEKKNFRYRSYSMNRSNFYCGRFIRWGLWYPDRKIRIFDKRIASWGGMNPHDRIVLLSGIATKQLRGDLLHYAYYSVEEHKRRNDQISSIAAESLFREGRKDSWLNFVIRPTWAFINGYFLKFGFLDGIRGLLVAIYTSQQTFLKYQKLHRLYRQEFEKKYS